MNWITADSAQLADIMRNQGKLALMPGPKMKIKYVTLLLIAQVLIADSGWCESLDESLRGKATTAIEDMTDELALIDDGAELCTTGITDRWGTTVVQLSPLGWSNGFQIGDVLKTVDGMDWDVENFNEFFGEFRLNDELKIELQRDEEIVSLDVTCGNRSEALKASERLYLAVIAADWNACVSEANTYDKSRGGKSRFSAYWRMNCSDATRCKATGECEQVPSDTARYAFEDTAYRLQAAAVVDQVPSIRDFVLARSNWLDQAGYGYLGSDLRSQLVDAEGFVDKILAEESEEFIDWLNNQFDRKAGTKDLVSFREGILIRLRNGVEDGGLGKYKAIYSTLNGPTEFGRAHRLSCRIDQTCRQMSSYYEQTQPKCNSRPRRVEYTFLDMNDDLDWVVTDGGDPLLTGKRRNIYDMAWSPTEGQFGAAISSGPNQMTEMSIDRFDGSYWSESTDEEVRGSMRIITTERSTGSCQLISPKAESRADTRESYGTCFAVSPTEVITSHHVVENASTVTVQFQDGREISAVTTQQSRATDLALLKINGQAPATLPLATSRSLSVGDQVFTLGFPVTSILGNDAKFTEGSVSALSGIQGDASYFQMSVPIQPGNSGGPVVNMRGEVVGVVAATAAVEAFFAASGSLPQNVNWASKSDYARLLFDAPASSTKATGRKDAIQKARSALCQVKVVSN